MQINVKTNDIVLAENLIGRMPALGFPAVLTDRNLKVISVNHPAEKYVRNGEKPEGFLPEPDIERIKEMHTGEIFSTAVTHDIDSCGATVVCGCDCFMFVLRPIAGDIRGTVLEKYGQMSGYDLDVSQHILTRNLLAPHKKRRDAEHLLKSILDEHPAVQRLPFFDADEVLRRIVKGLSEISPKYAKRLKTDIWINEMISEGSERDFILFTAFSLSFCLDCSSESELLLEAYCAEEGVVLRISCEADGDTDVNTELSEYLRCPHTSEELLDETRFWIYLLRLLADGNLWEFKTEHNGGHVSFYLCMPCVKKGDEFFVREYTDDRIRGVLEYFIGENKT